MTTKLNPKHAHIDQQIDALFKEYYPRLCAYATRFVGNNTAKDLVMDCFVKLWEKKDKLEDAALHSLLFVMVRNACLNHLKHKSLINFDNPDYLSNLSGEERMYNLDFNLSADQELLYDELQGIINNILDQLPSKCKDVFIKSRFEGKPNHEIAQETQTSMRNVEKHIKNALSIFTKCFKNRYSL